MTFAHSGKKGNILKYTHFTIHPILHRHGHKKVSKGKIPPKSACGASNAIKTHWKNSTAILYILSEFMTQLLKIIGKTC